MKGRDEASATVEEPRTDLVPVAPIVDGELSSRRTPSFGPAVFAASLVAFLLVFGPSALLLGGLGRDVAEEEPATPAPSIATPPPRSTVATTTRATTAPAGEVRVVSATGTATTQGSAYQVTFVWVLEGAREGDPIKIQFYAGTRMLTEREGALDPQIYTFSTGTLRIVTTQECSTAGWQADLVGVRGRSPAGDTLASAPGVSCR